MRGERPIGVVLQREAGVEDPAPLDLHRVGTTANVLRYVTAPDGNHHLICQGQQRFRILEFVGGHPFLAARFERSTSPRARRTEIEARFMLLRERALEAVELLPQAPRELADTIRSIGSAGQLADLAASTMDISPAEKQEVLETFDLARRLDRVLEFLNQRLGVLRLSREIGEATRGTLEKRQREALLREQLQTIRKELGEDEGTAAEVEDLKKAIDEAGMPEEVEQQANKELRRLERMPEAAAEHGMIRTYLDTLIELPWSKETEDRIDVAEAQRCSTRTTTTWRRSRSGSSSTRRPQAGARGPQPDPVLRRPAGRRQDQPRPEHRPRHGPQVRPRLPGRRARREPRSAAIGAPTSAPCPATSSRRSARPGRATRS